MVSIGSFFSSVFGLFGGLGWIKWLLLGLALAALLCAAAVHWNDYQTAKHDAVAYRGLYLRTVDDLDETARIAERNAAAWAKERSQLKRDLALSARVSSERLERMNLLSGQIARIKQIERPDNEKDCPVHPAISAAVDILREQEAGTGEAIGLRDESRDPIPSPGTASVHGRAADTGSAPEG